MAGTIKWVREFNGYYASTCGRFRISKDTLRRGRWTLFDTARKDSLQPQYDVMHFCHSLANAKSTAERCARLHPVGKPLIDIL